MSEMMETAVMTEREKRIMENFSRIIPKLSENDKCFLLGMGEGMTVKFEMQQKERERQQMYALADR